jgi:hypothetical protein
LNPGLGLRKPPLGVFFPSFKPVQSPGPTTGRIEQHVQLKHAVSLFVCVHLLYGGAIRDVKVDVMMTAGPDDLVNEYIGTNIIAALTSFAPDTPTLYLIFKAMGTHAGDKIRAVFIADDVGNVVQTGTKIEEQMLTATRDPQYGIFTLSIWSKDWPIGRYHVEIYVDDQLATKRAFTFEVKAN